MGPQRGKEQTFVLLDEFAPPGPDLDRPSALAMIAERFVRSHAPVSAHDLARWADLTVTDARAGLAAAEGVVPRTIDGRDLFVTEALLDAAAADGDPTATLPARALPGFDELVLGYRDRTAQLDADHEKLVVPGGNGVFCEHARRGRSRRRHLEAPGAGADRRHRRQPLRPDHRTRPPPAR